MRLSIVYWTDYCLLGSPHLFPQWKIPRNASRCWNFLKMESVEIIPNSQFLLAGFSQLKSSFSSGNGMSGKFVIKTTRKLNVNRILITLEIFECSVKQLTTIIFITPTNRTKIRHNSIIDNFHQIKLPIHPFNIHCQHGDKWKMKSHVELMNETQDDDERADSLYND